MVEKVRPYRDRRQAVPPARRSDTHRAPTPGLVALDTLPALQRSAGNRAVATLVSRWESGRTVPVQRGTDENTATYQELEGGMGEYASRVKRNDLDDKKVESSKKLQALVRERNDDGSLTEEGIRLLDEATYEDAEVMLFGDYDKVKITDKRKKGLFSNPKKALEKALKQPKNINTLSGESLYPELQNLLNPNKETEGPVTQTMDVSGTNMDVEYDKSDVNWQARLALLENAVAKVKDAGFEVPAMNVRLPKYARDIQVDKDCNISIDKKLADAQFVAPDTMHLGSGGLGNPKTDRTGEGELRFMSAQVDTTGGGSVVHELGHFLHRVQSPSKFSNLNFTVFKGKGSDVAAKVSDYASNPREFVAEVFTALIYGRTFPDDVIAVYDTFGGPMTEELRSQLKSEPAPTRVGASK